MSVPGDLKYTKDHEWVRIDGDTATFGVTDHAQEALGDIVFVDLPDVGRSITRERASPWSNRSRPFPMSTHRWPARSPR